MSSSKSNKKWKNKVLKDFLRISSILKFQDQITSVNSPNDAPQCRQRVFEKTVFRISHIDKEDCKPQPKKEDKLKNSDLLTDQSELIAEIDKNIKNLKDQKKFLKMERECDRTWGEHLLRNQYSNNCNRRSVPAAHHRSRCDDHVCEFLEKFITRNSVKVVDSCTQMECPCPTWICDRDDYTSPQCVDNMEDNRDVYCCRRNNLGHNAYWTSDCSSVDAEWKARKNNCNFREKPVKKVNSSTQVGPCKACPKPQCYKQKRVSLCSPTSATSSPRCGMSPCEGLDFHTRRPCAPKRRDCCSDESQDRFKTTYMTSYKNFSKNKAVSCTDKELRTKMCNPKYPRECSPFLIDENCARRTTKTKITCFSPESMSPRSPRKTCPQPPRSDSVEMDIRRMPYRPVKLSDELEQRRCGLRQKSPASRPFYPQSYSPRSPRKAGTYTRVNLNRAPEPTRFKKSPRPKAKSQPKNARSYSQVSPRSPTTIETYTQETRHRSSYSPRYKQSSRQITKSPEHKNERSNSQGNAHSPRKLEPSRQVSRTAYQRPSAFEPKNARSERSLYSKTVTSRQVTQTKPLAASNKESPPQIQEIYEESTKVKQFHYKSHETYGQSPPQSYDALDQEDADEIEYSSQQAYKTSSRSPTNDLSEASSSTPLRKLNIVKPNVIDDRTYIRPSNDESEDYVILPYSPLPKHEEEPVAYPPKIKEKLSESILKKSEVILEDASNVSIEQMENVPFKPPQQAYVIEEATVYHVSELILPQPQQVEEMFYITDTKYETEVELNKQIPKKESNRQVNDNITVTVVKSESTGLNIKPDVDDTALDIKPFRSEIANSTLYVKEDRPFKSDQEINSYSKISEEMSKRLQSSKIALNEDSVPNVLPLKKEEQTCIIKSEVDSQMSDTSQEGVFLSETLNPIEPIKSIDSELQNFITYLQNRLRDCDEMVRKQIERFDLNRKDVCQKVCKVEKQTSCDESDTSTDQFRVCHNYEASKPNSQLTCKCDEGHLMKNEIGELTIDSNQLSESELEYETDCHCYRCEGDQLSPIAAEIPPFTGCDCMKEDYYKIMRLVYNK